MVSPLKIQLKQLKLKRLFIKDIRLKGLFSTTCTLLSSKCDSCNIRKTNIPEPQTLDRSQTFGAFSLLKASKIEFAPLVPMISTFHAKHRKRTHSCVLDALEMDFGTYWTLFYDPARLQKMAFFQLQLKPSTTTFKRLLHPIAH